MDGWMEGRRKAITATGTRLTFNVYVFITTRIRLYGSIVYIYSVCMCNSCYKKHISFFTYDYLIYFIYFGQIVPIHLKAMIFQNYEVSASLTVVLVWLLFVTLILNFFLHNIYSTSCNKSSATI